MSQAEKENNFYSSTAYYFPVRKNVQYSKIVILRNSACDSKELNSLPHVNNTVLTSFRKEHKHALFPSFEIWEQLHMQQYSERDWLA